jgi:4-amino-4-deoxy-L-arabinose transferase-like glycosyltransferase
MSASRREPLEAPPWALAAVILLAASLRLLHLGTESLWIDEAFTVHNARLAFTELAGFSARDIHPPLYSFFMWAWVRVFGDSEFSIRLPAAIFGTLTVPLAAAITRRLYGSRAALAAAFVVAINVFFVHYSQEARSYALVGFLCAASTLAYLAGHERWSTPRVTLYLVATVALVYTHHAGWFLVAAQSVHAWLAAPREDERRRIAPWLGVQGMLLLAYVPWLGVVGAQLHHLSHAFWSGAPGWLTLPKLLWEFAGSPYLLAAEAALVVLAFVQPPGHGKLARGAPRGRAAFMVCWVLIPIAAPFTLAALGYVAFVARVAIASALALAVLVGAGIASMGRASAAAALIAVLGALALADYYGVTHKEPWRSAVADVERGAQAHDLVVIHAGYNHGTAWTYYARRTDLDVLAVHVPGDSLAISVPDSVRAAIAGHERAWLVLSRSDDREGVLRRLLAEGRRVTLDTVYASRSYEPARTRQFPGIELVRFVTPPR